MNIWETNSVKHFEQMHWKHGEDAVLESLWAYLEAGALTKAEFNTIMKNFSQRCWDECIEHFNYEGEEA
jgi:hypothetical protein